jgi:predicted permease
VDAGFNPSRLVTFSITLPQVISEPSGRLRTYQHLLDTLRAVPGVQAASAMSGLPPDRPVNANSTEIDNYTAPLEGPYEIVDYYQNVMGNYFETMGIPIVQGRSFQPTDAVSSGPVAVVNERLVNTFWKGQNPIGQRLRPCCGDRFPWFTVIGVAKDVKQGGLDQTTGTEFYFFVDQMGSLAVAQARMPLTMNIVLRTTLSRTALAGTIDRAVRDAAPSVPVARLQEMDDVFAESISRPRLLAQLLTAFGGLALVLAAVGTYGVLSFLVAERRREIGIRMALGARQSTVLSQVMRQGLIFTSVGIAIGLAGAVASSRLLASLLFGVEPTDPPTLAFVAGAILVVAAGACWLPAWRASHVDPSVVLRAD